MALFSPHKQKNFIMDQITEWLLFNRGVQMLLPMCFVWGQGQKNVLCACLQRHVFGGLGEGLPSSGLGHVSPFECVVSIAFPISPPPSPQTQQAFDLSEDFCFCPCIIIPSATSLFKPVNLKIVPAFPFAPQGENQDKDLFLLPY